MNDLDLRAALHRDADLVGEPAPDLLDRLYDRRRHQQRTRIALAGAVAAVVLVVAGIPVGASFLTGSDGGPATQTVEPTPSRTDEPAPTTSEATTPPATTTSAPVESETPTSETDVEVTEPAVPETPECPDVATLDAALPPDTADHTYTMFPREVPVCAGTWAAAGYSETWIDPAGEELGDGQTGLFLHVDGAWTFQDRWTTCDTVDLPEAVWQRACWVD
ncbi:hypothetical protein ACI797_21835 [Geodermatophilus sp. SYSU D00691]